MHDKFRNDISKFVASIKMKKVTLLLCFYFML